MPISWDNAVTTRLHIYRRQYGEYMAFDQFMRLCGASPRMAQRMLSMGLIDRTWINGKAMAPLHDLPRVRKILRLRYDLGVSWSSMAMVLRLLDRIEDLEQALDECRSGRSHGHDEN